MVEFTVIDEPEDIGPPRKEGPYDYWVMVALDYGMEKAYVMAMSEDFMYVDGDINHDNLLDDSNIGGVDEWAKDAVPGLWKVWLRPWSYQSYEGEWDCGWDIDTVPDFKPKLIAPFPEGENWWASHIHKKRETLYFQVGTGHLQTEMPIGDMEPVTIYMGDDGKYWVRPTAEFEDGRFDTPWAYYENKRLEEKNG
jgi:hypothetical protein